MHSLITEGEPMVAGAANGVSSVAWLLIALPLLGAAVLLLGGRRTDKVGPALAKLIEFNTSCAPVFVQRAGLAALAQADAFGVNWPDAGGDAG